MQTTDSPSSKVGRAWRQSPNNEGRLEAFRCPKCGAVVRYQLHVGYKAPLPECTNPICQWTLDDLHAEQQAEAKKREDKKVKAGHEMDLHKWIRAIKY